MVWPAPEMPRSLGNATWATAPLIASMQIGVMTSDKSVEVLKIFRTSFGHLNRTSLELVEMSSHILFASSTGTALEIHGVAAPNPVAEGFEARNKVLVEISRVQLGFAAFQMYLTSATFCENFHDF